jgi:ABC-2 type transport system permease protein
MNTLLKIELRKNLTNTTFWLLIGFYMVFLFFAVYALQGVDLRPNNLPPGEVQEITLGFFAFPLVWKTVGYIAGFMGLFLAILVVINITNEFSFRTFRQSIINGMSRREFLSSKLILVLAISLFATFWVLVVSWLIGTMNTPADGVGAASGMAWISAIFMQIFGYLSLAVLFSFLLRNTGLTIFLYLAYTIIIERVLWILPRSINRFFPVSSLDNLIPSPFPDSTMIMGAQDGWTPFFTTEMAFAFVWIMIFWGLSYWLLRSRDL